MIERINERLGRPDRCPHGWPVEPEVEQAENAELTPLGELAAGSEAEIVRLAEHDGDLLDWFYDEGLVPGTHLSVRGAQPAAGQLTVAVGGAERALSEKAADGIYVRAS
jgi:DtxR family Mn-dependent transcriptional regulator